MASNYVLVAKTCRAVQCYVRAGEVSGLDSDNVRAHKEAVARAFPNVTIRSTGAMPKSGNYGTWVVEVEVAVSTSMAIEDADASDTRVADSDTLAGAVFDLFFQNMIGGDASGLADAITSAARAAAADGGEFSNLNAFICDSVQFNGQIDLQENGDGTAYVDVLPLKLTVRTATT